MTYRMSKSTAATNESLKQQDYLLFIDFEILTIGDWGIQYHMEGQ